jgi:predicted NBD/HSP70 family sugar kinase
MFYLGIDIGKFHHAAALINQQGKLIAALPSFPNTRGQVFVFGVSHKIGT